MFSLAVGIYYAFKDRKKLVDNYYFGGRNMSPVIMFYLLYILQAGRVSRQLRGVEKYCFCWLHQLHPNDFDESTEQKLLYIGATDSLLQNCFDDNRNKLFIYVNLFPDLVHPLRNYICDIKLPGYACLSWLQKKVMLSPKIPCSRSQYVY